MTRAPATRANSPAPRAATTASAILLAAFTVLSVARPLVPSEVSAARGGGQMFVVAWIVLAAAWLLLMATGRKPAVVWFSRGDWLVLALFAWIVGAGLWNAPGGATRPALNLVGEFLALAIAYLLARQLVRGTRTMRAFVAAMIALAAVQAALGLFQYAVTMPATRAAYRLNPEQALVDAGLNAPPGSPERSLFEHRLESREPLARFELTNSLAGFLLVWLVALVATSAASGARALGAWGRADHAAWCPRTPGEDRPSNMRLWLSVGVLALLIAACLVLTKSRSAYLAAAAAGAMLLAWHGRRAAWFTWRRVAAVAVLVAAAVGVGVLAGGLDREVVTEAPKSLGYRLQYWRATLRLIADAPLAGVGLANFGDQYTRYKEPTASEEIADPHNFVLETAAVAGVPAALMLLALLATLIWNVRSGDSPEADADPTAPKWIAIGAALAPPLAALAGILADVPLTAADLLIIYVAGAAAFALLLPWQRTAGPLAVPLAIAAAALALNLLAAGGFGFPSVAGSFWLALALTRTATTGDTDRREINPRAAAFAAACMTAAAIGACLLSFNPVVASQSALREAQTAPGTPEVQRARLEAAAAADPLSPDPWAHLAGMQLDLLAAGPPTPEGLAEFRRLAGQWLRRSSGANSATWLHAGDLYLAAYTLSRSGIDLRAALDAYRRAVATYPHNARRRAKLALALQTASDPGAAEQAAEAWRLDARTPHADQKLPRDLREALTKRGLGDHHKTPE